jgi:hypothetical protein
MDVKIEQRCYDEISDLIHGTKSPLVIDAIKPHCTTFEKRFQP